MQSIQITPGPMYLINNIDGTNVVIAKTSIYLTTDKVQGSDRLEHNLRNIYTDKSICVLNEDAFHKIKEDLYGPERE